MYQIYKKVFGRYVKVNSIEINSEVNMLTGLEIDSCIVTEQDIYVFCK